MKKVIISIWLIFGIILVLFNPLTMVTVAEAKSGAKEMGSYQMLQLSEDAKNLLEKNGFVVVPTKAYKDMNHAYEAFRKDNLANFSDHRFCPSYHPSTL